MEEYLIIQWWICVHCSQHDKTDYVCDLKYKGLLNLNSNNFRNFKTGFFFFFNLFFVVLDLYLSGGLNAWITCSMALSMELNLSLSTCQHEVEIWKKRRAFWNEWLNSVHCIPPTFPIFLDQSCGLDWVQRERFFRSWIVYMISGICVNPWVVLCSLVFFALLLE